MKVLFVALGSVGDVKPCLHLGIGLQRLGHQVVIAANESYREMAERFQLSFHSLTGEQDFAVSTHRDFKHPEKGLKVIADLLLGTAKPVVDFVLEHRDAEKSDEQPDTILLAPTRVLGARIAQELLDVPLISLQMAPLYFTSFDGYPADLAETVLGPRLDRIRSDLGLAAREQVLADWQYSPRKVLGLFPSWFAATQSDWPQGSELLNFVLAPVEKELPGPLGDFLDDGPAPLVFSPGTYTRDTGAFFRTALNVVERLEKRAVFVPVHNGLNLGPLPESIFAADWVDYSALLPRCAGLIHAGGIGTCAEAVRAGVAQLMIPEVFDQKDNAERLATLGAGLTRSPEEFVGEGAVEAVRELISTRKLRAKARSLRARMGAGPRIYVDFVSVLHEVLGIQTATPGMRESQRIKITHLPKT